MADLLSPFRKKFYLYLLIVSFYEAAQVVNSYLLTGAIRISQSEYTLWTWVAFFVAIEMFDTFFRWYDHMLDWHVFTKLDFSVEKHIKMLVLRIFLGQDSAWHQKNNSGVLLGKAQNGASKVTEMLNVLMWEFTPTLMQAALTLPPLIFYTPLVAVLALLSLGLFLFITKQAEDFRLPLRKKRHDLYEDLWQRTEEAVKAHETVTIYGQTDRIIAEQSEINDQILALSNKEIRGTVFKYHDRRVTVIQMTSRATLGILLWQLTHKSISVGEVFFVYMLSERLLSSYWRFARLMQRVGECSEGIARLHALSKVQPEICDGPLTQHDMQTPEKITVEFDHVSFAYPGNEREALRNMSLMINDREEVAIVGPSGSGKTTLRRLLLRLFEVTDGEILVGGIPIKNWPLKKLRSLFAYVPQGDEVFIFDSNIEDNIRFSRPEATDEDVIRSAKQAGLQDFINSLPDGYKTRVGEKGLKLSGGQKQRIALARAIVSDRKFLILDEATSSVDALTEQEIQHELKEVLSDVTSVVIAHRMQTIWHADKIVVMKDGEKEAEGSHRELMDDSKGIYRQMVALQTQHEL